MTWTVVEFLGSHEVEAVPTSWLYQEENSNTMKCYWPPLELGAIEKAIKNKIDVNTCWPLYDVHVFKNGTFGDYQTARAKSKKAEDTSDLSSCNEGKRKMRPLSSSSDEENGHERSILPSPPGLFVTSGRQSKKLFLNEVAKESASPNIIDECRTDSIFTPTGKRPNKLRFISPAKESINLSSAEVSADEHNNTETTRERERICSCCPMHSINRFEKLLTEIVEGQKNIKLQVLQLRDDIKSSEHNITRTESESLFTKFKCPVSSEADMAMIETYLEETKNYKSAVVEFSKLGGRDLYDFIRRCLSSLMKNKLGEIFSYHGKKNKRAFKSLKINGVIIEAANLRKDGDKKMSEDSIGKWLKRAKERKDE